MISRDYSTFLLPKKRTYVTIMIGDCMDRIILHIDVNNAFLSWTAVYLLKTGFKKDIRKEYAVIGGNEQLRKGVVLAKSDLAKRCGITTGEPLFQARKKCPYLKVYPTNHKIYRYYSNLMYQYLKQYTPDIERYSIDECFLDYTKSKMLFGEPINVAQKIKNDIKKLFGFTVNIGIGPNKLCAKMASDFEKPDKIHTLYYHEIETKLWPLPVSDLFMIGKQTTKKLHELKINTVFELAHSDINFLYSHFKSAAQTMWNYANGIDNSIVESTKKDPKSISMTTVLPYDYQKKEELLFVIKKLSMEVGRKLRKQNKYANMLVINIKYKDFSKISKQQKTKQSINSDDDIYREASQIFCALWNLEKVRSLTVGVGDLDSQKKIQLSIFEYQNYQPIDSNLQELMSVINQKYGENKIVYGNLLKKEKE